MTPTELAAALIAGVPTLSLEIDGALHDDPHGFYMDKRAVLAALTAALDGVDAERVGATLEQLKRYFWAYSSARNAADLITALLAQIAALRAGVEQRDAAIEKMLNHCEATEERAEAAEAKVEKLRGGIDKLEAALIKAVGQRKHPAWGVIREVRALTTEAGHE